MYKVKQRKRSASKDNWENEGLVLLQAVTRQRTPDPVYSTTPDPDLCPGSPGTRQTRSRCPYKPLVIGEATRPVWLESGTDGPNMPWYFRPPALHTKQSASGGGGGGGGGGRGGGGGEEEERTGEKERRVYEHV